MEPLDSPLSAFLVLLLRLSAPLVLCSFDSFVTLVFGTFPIVSDVSAALVLVRASARPSCFTLLIGIRSTSHPFTTTTAGVYKEDEGPPLKANGEESLDGARSCTPTFESPLGVGWSSVEAVHFPIRFPLRFKRDCSRESTDLKRVYQPFNRSRYRCIKYHSWLWYRAATCLNLHIYFWCGMHEPFLPFGPSLAECYVPVSHRIVRIQVLIAKVQKRRPEQS